MLGRLLMVGTGGGAGAIVRYAVGLWLTAAPGGVPAGTLIVNVTGSLLLGLLLAYTAERPAISTGARLLLGTGFCGGYTTFSTFSYDTLRLLTAGAYLAAGLNAVLNLLLALGGCLVGIWLARLL